MATFDLIPHPRHPSAGIANVTVQVEAEPDHVALIFSIVGDPTTLVIPPKAKPLRTDGLWRTTCCELFVAMRDGRYVELNFAPSTEWAAYTFDAYRSGMRLLAIGETSLLDAPPNIWTESGSGVRGFHLGTAIGPLELATSIGLSAIIEEQDGTKSYWALRHGDGPPDFHDPDCFIATLPAPERP